MYRCINLQTFNLALYNLMNKGLALAAPFFLLRFTANQSVLHNNILLVIEQKDVGITKDRFFPQQNKHKNSVSNAIQTI